PALRHVPRPADAALRERASRLPAGHPVGMADPVARLRAICLALPAVSEKASHGEAAWFVGAGKTPKQFVSTDDHHHGADWLAFWCAAPPGAQEALIATDAEQFFRPPYVGHRGWVGVRIDLPDLDWVEIDEIVRDAYRQVAPKTLAAQLDASTD